MSRPKPPPIDAKAHMQTALTEARKSPPKPTNFCVGACIVVPSAPEPIVLVTGYTLECAGNTHAEQSCFLKFAARHDCAEEDIGLFLPAGAVLFTTMEPCNRRSPGNLPCTERIVRLRRSDGSPALAAVYVGVSEPETFVGVNEGRQKLLDAGIQVVHVPGFEDDILRVATAGHPKDEERQE